MLQRHQDINEGEVPPHHPSQWAGLYVSLESDCEAAEIRIWRFLCCASWRHFRPPQARTGRFVSGNRYVALKIVPSATHEAEMAQQLALT